MKNKLVTLIALVFIGGSCWGQITFQNAYSSNGEDFIAAQTSDGGYIIVGVEGDSSNTNIWLLKLNAYGDTSWTKTFNNGGDDIPISMQQTFDGGYVIAGGYFNIFLIRTDSVGDTLWTKSYGVPNGGDAHGNVVRQTADSGFIIGGSELLGVDGYDYLLIKTDKNGDKLWSKSYGTRQAGWGFNNDYLSDVQPTKDGGYIIAGSRFLYSGGGEAALIIKTDSFGTPVWNNIYGDSVLNPSHIPQSIRLTLDGGYIVQDMGSGSPYIYKLNGGGAVQWIRYCDASRAPIIPTNDGGYALPCYGGMIKTDSIGDTLWTKTYNINNSGFNSIKQTGDSGFILTGSVNDTLGYSLVVKTDANGNSDCSFNAVHYIYNDTTNLEIIDTVILASFANTLLIPSTTIVGNTTFAITPCFDLSVNKIENENSITIFPNPATNELTIKNSGLKIAKSSIYIMNTLGQMVFSSPLLWRGVGGEAIDVSKLPSGIYFVRVVGEKESWAGKFVKSTNTN